MARRGAEAGRRAAAGPLPRVLRVRRVGVQRPQRLEGARRPVLLPRQVTAVRLPPPPGVGGGSGLGFKDPPGGVGRSGPSWAAPTPPHRPHTKPGVRTRGGGSTDGVEVMLRGWGLGPGFVPCRTGDEWDSWKVLWGFQSGIIFRSVLEVRQGNSVDFLQRAVAHFPEINFTKFSRN